MDLYPGLESLSLAEAGLETGTLKVEVNSRVESGSRVSTAGFEPGPGWNLADTCYRLYLRDIDGYRSSK